MGKNGSAKRIKNELEGVVAIIEETIVPLTITYVRDYGEYSIQIEIYYEDYEDILTKFSESDSKFIRVEDIYGQTSLVSTSNIISVSIASDLIVTDYAGYIEGVFYDEDEED